MGRRIGPAKIKQYSLEFKLKAVQLSSQPGVLIKDVAESLCIHPFMLSKWRAKVSTQWQLYCLVHNVEKLAHNGYR